MDTDLVQRFMDKHTVLSGKPHRVASAGIAAEIVAEVLSAAGAHRVALANLDPELCSAVEQRATALAIEVIKEPYPASSLPHSIDEAQVGVTGMAFGIAQTATLAEVATNDAQRLVSALPRIHIGVVYAKDIVESLEDAAPLLRSIFEQNPANCAVSFISGPSRTGDIELKLTLGVHGPGEQHAIIIED